jgi:hypothetical protein
MKKVVNRLDGVISQKMGLFSLILIPLGLAPWYNYSSTVHMMTRPSSGKLGIIFFCATVSIPPLGPALHNHSSLSITKVKNSWSNISTPSYVLMV